MRGPLPLIMVASLGLTACGSTDPLASHRIFGFGAPDPRFDAIPVGVPRGDVHSVLGTPDQVLRGPASDPVCDGYAYDIPNGVSYTHIRYDGGTAVSKVTGRPGPCAATDPLGNS